MELGSPRRRRACRRTTRRRWRRRLRRPVVRRRKRCTCRPLQIPRIGIICDGLTDRCGRCFGVSSGLSVVARALGADLEHPAFGARQAPRLVGLDAQSKEVHVEESVSLPSQTATGEFTPLAAVASIPEPPPEPKPRWPGPGAPPPLVANRYQPWAPPRREPEELPRSESRRRPSKRGWR
jgi:hypothetical protein